MRQSYFESTTRRSPRPIVRVHADGRVSGGEIGHVHVDGSCMLCWPGDAAAAIEHAGSCIRLGGRPPGLAVSLRLTMERTQTMSGGRALLDAAPPT